MAAALREVQEAVQFELAARAANDASSQTVVVWAPIPGTSQELALDTRADITLYHGTRGPGKTVTQLMRFRRYVGLGYGAFWRGVVFDLEFKNFADILAQAKRFFYSFNDGVHFKESASEYKWTWPTGEELLFRHAKKIGDYDDYHGHEYPFIGWNELTKYSTGDLYEKMMSCNRTSFTPWKDTPHDVVREGTKQAIKCEDGIWRLYHTPDRLPLPPIRLQVFATTNPSGVGHNWVKREIIDKSKPGQIYRTKTKVFDPRTREEVIVEKTQVHIWGSHRENIYLPAAYIAKLQAIKDPNLRRAWFLGDWDVTAGGALDDLFRDHIHVIERFPVPKHWRLDRSFDWGSTKPFAVLWWAECNGEEAKLPDGRIWCPPAGTLILVAEWYGCGVDDTGKPRYGDDVGVKMSSEKIAEGIKEREIGHMNAGHFKTQPKPGPADNQIRNVVDTSEGVETIEKKMANKGIRWTESDKSPGSNSVGLQAIRDRLEAAIEQEGPALYFMRGCPATLALLPPIPRDEIKTDEASKEYENHIYDAVKYRVLGGNNRVTTELNVTFS